MFNCGGGGGGIVKTYIDSFILDPVNKCLWAKKILRRILVEDSKAFLLKQFGNSEVKNQTNLLFVF